MVPVYDRGGGHAKVIFGGAGGNKYHMWRQARRSTGDGGSPGPWHRRQFRGGVVVVCAVRGEFRRLGFFSGSVGQDSAAVVSATVAVKGQTPGCRDPNIITRMQFRVSSFRDDCDDHSFHFKKEGWEPRTIESGKEEGSTQ